MPDKERWGRYIEKIGNDKKYYKFDENGVYCEFCHKGNEGFKPIRYFNLTQHNNGPEHIRNKEKVEKWKKFVNELGVYEKYFIFNKDEIYCKLCKMPMFKMGKLIDLQEHIIINHKNELKQKGILIEDENTKKENQNFSGIILKDKQTNKTQNLQKQPNNYELQNFNNDQTNTTENINSENIQNKKRKSIEIEPLTQPIFDKNEKALSDILCKGVGSSKNNFFKEIKDQILKNIKFNSPSNYTEENNYEGLNLSSLTKQKISEEMREKKISKLSENLFECFNKKKCQLEKSYRNDCETFGFVTQKLVEKDKALEERLKVALLETMNDLENETLKKLDEFLDQISFNCN
ncbi:hypothetical protein ACQ4LE_010954 [Meloidogyne hapla]